MLPDWLKKKCTFVIIPEANRQVRRLQMPVFWMYFLPALAGMLIAAITVLGSSNTVLLKTNNDLKAKWEADVDSHKQMLSIKDDEIAKLQDEIVRLTQEAEGFAAKISELQLLEQEILSLTTDGELRNTTTAAIEIADSKTASVAVLSHGVGGEYVPLDSDGILNLSEGTRGSLIELAGEADRLKLSLQQALEEAEKLAYLRSVTPSIYPTLSTQITSGFGYRRDPFTGKKASHKGIDFGGRTGDPVFATAAGKVTSAGYDKTMGNHIIIQHGNGLETVYMHLSKTKVKKGQNVKKGEKIGTLGNTGRSTGPHLHYEVHKNGTPINPKPYIKN